MWHMHFKEPSKKACALRPKFISSKGSPMSSAYTVGLTRKAFFLLKRKKKEKERKKKTDLEHKGYEDTV